MAGTYREILNEIDEGLKEAGIAEHENDAWLIISHFAKISRARYLAHPEDEPTADVARAIYAAASEREKRVPLQHITGEAYFYGRRFLVDENVLVPRFDTEILVEKALGYVKSRVAKASPEVQRVREDVIGEPSGEIRVLDMCTGSGCIAIAIEREGARLSEQIEVSACDISDRALEIARKNAGINGSRVRFFKSDMFDAVDGRYDLIVSNPPYIRTDEIETLAPEVRDHDPMIALDGGADGLLFYRSIAEGAVRHLKVGGRIFLEIGCDQYEDVRDILEKAGFSQIDLTRDLAGKDRVVSAALLCDALLEGRVRRNIEILDRTASET